MPWWDFFKLWSYSFEKGPYERKRDRERYITGAGVAIPDAIFDARGEAWGGGSKGLVRASHDSNDFIDMSTTTNRQARYKEYDRLRNVAEIEMAMTVIADEACIASRTKIATLFDGFKTIQWLTERWEREKQPFLVYCWDFEENDYTLGWAYDPRVVKIAKTVKIALDDGSYFVVTPDHRVLKTDGHWTCAGDLKHGDELKPFYKIMPNRFVNELPKSQFPRIFTFSDGWKNERQFMDEWRLGRVTKHSERLYEAARVAASGLSQRQITKVMKKPWPSINNTYIQEGFTYQELKWLGRKTKFRRVIGIHNWNEAKVYDLSVKDHENFCTDSVVMHNCQRDPLGNIIQIDCPNPKVKEELNFLLFNRKMLNLNRKSWGMVKRLCMMGDGFYELIMNPESPKDGILKIQELPPDSMYRIETTKCRLVEYQQSKEGPDYLALTRSEITKATEAELQQSVAIRFAPKQIVHFRLGEDRKTFYPYGQSLIEPARGPAHQLRLMEDAMVVYRLTRAPERRVFYIDIGQLPSNKAEAFIERMKDQFRKRKVGVRGEGANAVEERWAPHSAEEDYWLPIRGQSNTRIDTLPGAQNLGEIDDALYFRNKLFAALNFPRNYFNNEDPSQTRITLSAQDVKFARMIERIQGHFIDGILEICERHLELRGWPEEAYEDLKLEMTPPSAWKELSEAEIMNNRIQIITSLKSAMLMADRDLLTRYMHFSEDEAEEIESRTMIQKLQDLKLQVMGQNPQLMGVGVPGSPSGEQELGAESGGPNPMLGGEPAPQEGTPEGTPPPAPPPTPPKKSGAPLPEPEIDDIKRYDLEIQTYSRDVDAEDVDHSEQ